MYRKSSVLSVCSGRRKIKYMSSGMGYSNAFNSWIPVADHEARISVSDMLGSQMETEVKTNPSPSLKFARTGYWKERMWKNYCDF